MSRPRMFQLVTPPGMLFTTALLVIYCAYAFLIGSIEDSTPLLLGGFVAVCACYGTAMVRPWSRFLVYALTAGFICKLSDSLMYAYRAGYFEFQFGSAAEIAATLVPSLAMTLVSVVCCALVYRQFRTPAHAESRAALPASETAG
jgi:hypothetical protein